MADFSDSNAAFIIETEENMDRRHDLEAQQLEEQIKGILKQAKKGDRAMLEAQIVQMRFDLRAKHREEVDSLVDSGGGGTDDDVVQKEKIVVKRNSPKKEDEIDELLNLKIAEKIYKAKMKKGKRAEKEAERRQLKSELKENAGPNMREIELAKMNKLLAEEGLKVKEVPADGHCMYRAIADQLRVLQSSSSYTTLQIPSTLMSLVSDRNSTAENIVACLRAMTAEHILTEKEEFAPFLDIDVSSTSDAPEELLAYCNRIRSMDSAEWGGQIELKALSALLSCQIVVYDLTAPSSKITMGEGTADSTPVRVTYHRHFYALGEHYNSTQLL